VRAALGLRAALNLGPTFLDRVRLIDPLSFRRPQCGRSGIQRAGRLLERLDSRSGLRSAENDNEAMPDEAVSYATYLITCQNIPATQTKPSVKSTVLR
jgi:hypothetical protein